MWYATHCLMQMKFKDREQESYPVLERVVLVEAFDHEEARKKGSLLAHREQEEYTGPGYRWSGGRPVDCVFLGVRKVTCVSDEGAEGKLADGVEVTCWEYEVREGDLTKLTEGKRVTVEYIE